MKRNKILPKLLSGIKFPDMLDTCGFHYASIKATLINYFIKKQLQMKTIATILIGILLFTNSQSTEAQNFYLHPNGVTCLCPNAAVGETGVVNGITYTKREIGQITTQNASTTCTSGITSMDGLFHNKFFNEDISSWDLSSVYSTRMMFSNNSTFNQPINHWDVSNVITMERMFENSQFNQPIDNWDVSSVTNMSWMFYNSEFNKTIANWDVSNVTNMGSMFYTSQFNQPIGNWNVSNVTDMSYMFSGSQFNKPIIDWNVSNVTDMSYMFQFASQFNQPLNNWDVSNVIDMSNMFAYSQFNQSIGNWNVSNVTNMNSMFYVSQFNQPIGDWDVSNVTNMGSMFDYAPFNQPIGNWDVSNVIDMSMMFRGSQFNRPISDWNVINVTNMSRMFFGCPFNHPIGDWDVSNVTNMSSMFCSGSQFNQPIGNWDVSSVADMSDMFNSSEFNQSISNWNVSNVTNMARMFAGSPFNQPIGDWDVSNVTNMSGMLAGSQFNQPIGNWDVSNVTNMSGMFSGSQFNQPIANWDVSNVTNTSSMFESSQFDQAIDLWDMSNVTDMSYMFYESQFNQPIDGWDVSNVTDMSCMFQWSQFNQPIGAWDVSNVTNMVAMFLPWFGIEQSFNQDISTWLFNPDVIFSSDNVGFIYGNTFSAENYDLLLQSFSDQNLQNKIFPAYDLVYCNSSARNDLITNKGWTITGDVTILTSIDAPENISLIAAQDSCFVSNVDLGIPTSQSCTAYAISNDAPSIYPLGSTNVIWTITDGNGITNSDNQTVLVTTPDGYTSIPTSITAPANLTLSVDEGSCFASNVVLGLPSASSCLSYSISNDAPIIFPIGETQIMWTITDSDGFSDQDFQTVTVAIDVDEASVCYVSSDDIEITKNRIFINNLDWNNVVHYEVLRESDANYFQPIGILTLGETSFLDSTSNNASQTYRYVVRTLDICDNFSPFSSIHRTILLQSNISVNNTVNLSWINYEGISFNSYKIYRKVNSGDFELIATVSSNTSVYTDTQANVAIEKYEYYVAIDVQPCTTGNKFSFYEIKSNKAFIGVGGILDDFQKDQIVIHPNPIFNILTIKLPENVSINSCTIYNSYGQKVMTSNTTSFSVEHLPPSTYYMNITTSVGNVTKPFIKIDTK